MVGEVNVKSSSLQQSIVPLPKAGSCFHVESFIASKGLLSFTVISEHFVTCCSEIDRKRRAISCVCFKCRSDNRLHFCLNCVYAGCFGNKHIHSHYQSKPAHCLAVDVNHGQVYCFPCNDYKYHVEFDNILSKYWNIARKAIGLHSMYKPWEPNEAEVALLKKHPKRRRLSRDTTIGLRGLINLGNTCFMSVIMQVLIHTPILRDFFLSDNHHCTKDTCLVCEIARLYQEFHCAIRTPHIPYKLLHLIWTHAKHLAGYEQQDAHEFLISALDMLHKRCVDDRSLEDGGSTLMGFTPSIGTSNSHMHQACNCVIDQIFTGYLQSDVTCTSCHNVSTTIDPFWDISLDIVNDDALSPTRSDIHITEPIGKKSLLGCLRRYTRQEHLGSAAKIQCASCQQYQESTKQLSLHRLPMIMCFHLKRFQHTTGLHRKITDYVSFPLAIDLSTYTSKAIAHQLRMRQQQQHQRQNGVTSPRAANGPLSVQTADNNIFDSDKSPQKASEKTIGNAAFPPETADCRYNLYAVINHTGHMDNGHYTCFIRHRQDQWFNCDDHLIRRASVEDVLASQAYLLFYYKQILHYQ